MSPKAVGIVDHEMFSYRGHRFDVPVLDANRWMILRPSHVETSAVPGAHRLWDQDRFLTPHIPSSHGRLPDPQRSDARILDLPVKLPGQGSVTLPSVACHASTFVQRAMDAAFSAHRDAYEASFAYLTIDNGVTPPGSHQRKSGLHVDGFQGERVGDSLPADFSYICWFGTGVPTEFYPYPFDVRDLDRAKHDFGYDFEVQAAVKQMRPVFARPNVIYGMSAFAVHAAGMNITPFPQRRTFMRLSFSVREFDRLGNAANPFLPLDWEMVPRHNTLALDRVREMPL